MRETGTARSCWEGSSDPGSLPGNCTRGKPPHRQGRPQRDRRNGRGRTGTDRRRSPRLTKLARRNPKLQTLGRETCCSALGLNAHVVERGRLGEAEEPGVQEVNVLRGTDGSLDGPRNPSETGPQLL